MFGAGLALAVAADAVAQVATSTAPPIAPLGGAENGRTSSQMYHDRRERRRLSAATALVQAGNCTAATAYALRERSPDTVVAVQRMCAAQTEAAGALSDAEGEIVRFGADPRHPLFALVRPQMARLLREGRASSLQEAYDAAVAMRAAEARAAWLPK